MKTGSLIVASAAFFLAAATASAGELQPCPDDYQDQASRYIESRMDDSRAARIQFVGDPYPVNADFRGANGGEGWGVDVRVKTRLPNAAASGYVPYTVIFIDGRPVALEDDAVRMARL